MTAALELDPFRLPMPNPTTPVIPRQRLVPRATQLNPRYADPVWPMAAMTANPSKCRNKIKWDSSPPVFREELRLIAWTMINGELRPTFLKDRGHKMRSRLAPDSLVDAVREWRHLAAWLDAQGVHSLAGCGTEQLREYGLRLRAAGTSRGHVAGRLATLTRLWAFDQLSARPVGVGRPPWDIEGVDDFLPAPSRPRGENTTEALAEQTMGPLLCWAMRVVEDFADDIFAAREEQRRLSSAAAQHRDSDAGLAALQAYLRPLLIAKAPIPAMEQRGQWCIGHLYLAGITGASLRQVKRVTAGWRLTQAAAEHPGACPLTTPVTGCVGGVPWRQSVDFYEIPVLMRHLGTAAFIVCAYLTGMRPQEVLGMRSGCCPDPEPVADGTVGRHLIRSHEFKNVVDEDGNHVPAGLEREVPWVAVAPVVTAIRVLERMAPPGWLLFDCNVHDRFGRFEPGAALKPESMRKRIEDFVAWANREAECSGRPWEVIAPDPHGKMIGVARFRRSLAWHIARRPGGLVALAIQYGHMRTGLNLDVSEGYGSRSRAGIHDLIDVETALATAQTAAELYDHYRAGGGVSGPAARAALLAAASAPRFEGQQVSVKFARKYLARDGQVLFDNPHALLICRYRSDRALCERETAATPRLDGCVRGCGNTVRTDAHAQALRLRADALDQRADHTPAPIAGRLRAKAAQARADADAHDRARITSSETTP